MDPAKQIGVRPSSRPGATARARKSALARPAKKLAAQTARLPPLTRLRAFNCQTAADTGAAFRAIARLVARQVCRDRGANFGADAGLIINAPWASVSVGARALLPIIALRTRPVSAIAAAIVNIIAVAGVVITTRPAKPRTGIAIGHRPIPIGITIIAVIGRAVPGATIAITAIARTIARTIAIAGGAGAQTQGCNADNGETQ